MFEIANDNFEPGELPVDIPASKAKAREWLAEKMKVAPAITHCRYVAPPEPEPWTPRKRVAANDNEPQAWPLLEAMRRDGRESDMGVVRRYRLLCEVVAASPFGLSAGGADEDGSSDDQGVNVEARSLRLKGVEEVERDARADFPGKRVRGGEISYRETRVTVRSIPSVGLRANVTTPDTGIHQTHTPLRFQMAEGDRLAQIDGRPILAELRAALDVDPFDDGVSLLEVFEDAAIGCRTLTDIGALLKFKHKARSREAKLRIYTAIDILRDGWRRIEQGAARIAEECEQRVLARRAELAAAKAQYLGLAA